MLVLFAVLPTLLMLGIAVQGPAIYLAAIVPGVFFWKRGISAEDTRFLQKIALLMIALWVIFPAFDALHLVLGTHEAPSPGLRKLLGGRMSSSFLGTGVVLLATALASRLWPQKLVRHGVDGGRILWGVCFGLSIATILLGPVLLYQAVTGFTYGNLSRHVSGITENGLFRIAGFYGNSLWMSAVALGIFSYSWYLFWRFFGERTLGANELRNAVLEIRVPWARKIAPWTTLVTAAGNFGFVLLAGGRTATAAAFVMLVIIPFMVKMSPKGTLVRMWALGGSVAIAGATVLAMGFASRILGTVQTVQAGQQFDARSEIWKVHLTIIRDFPLFGAGNNWLEAGGIRADYYRRLLDPALFETFRGLLAHNLYLQILCDVGIVGAIIIIAIVSYATFTIWRHVHNRLVPRAATIAFAVAFAANLLHGVTENTYFSSNITLVTTFLLLVVMWTSIARGEGGAENGSAN